jgi:hypothetical protein
MESSGVVVGVFSLYSDVGNGPLEVDSSMCDEREVGREEKETKLMSQRLGNSWSVGIWGLR